MLKAGEGACTRLLGQALEMYHGSFLAVDSYKKAIEVEGLAERLYRELMRCLMTLGQRSEAVALYGRLERILDIKLDLRPAPATEALYQRLLEKR